MDAYLLALASYRFPDSADPQERRMIRFRAVLEMRAIQRRLPMTNVPSPGVITASPSSRST
jgi:hypothetical protein